MHHSRINGSSHAPWRSWMARAFSLATTTLTTLIAATAFAQSVVVGVVGDFGAAAEGPIYASRELAVANLIKRWNPDYILTLGDNNYPSGSAATIDINIGQFYHDYIHPYRGAYGPGADTNRFFPSLGNHDWAQSGQASIDYFTLPGNERYYRFRASPDLEWFALNSNPDVDGTTATSTQGVWLQNALANSTARWKLVYFHHPPYSADAVATPSLSMRWPFAAWGATLVLSGHEHYYARLQTNGMTYVINGLGGDEIHGYGGLTPGVAVRYNAEHGALRIEASATNLVCQFLSRSDDIVDTFVLGDPMASPFIMASPASQTALAGRTVQFSVLATGSPPPLYQWLANAIPAPNATNRTLVIPEAQLADEGDYAVVITCGNATVQTVPVRLTVLRQPLITLQPISLTASSGANATLRVVAEGAGDLRYQWRFTPTDFADAADLAGATNAQLALTGLALADAGRYEVVIRDDLGTTVSEPATLTVLARPVVTVHPVGQTALPGETVVWSVTAEGLLPMNYSWRLNGRVLTNIMLNSQTCFWAIANVQMSNAGNYQVGITNLAGPAARLTSNAFLVVLADRDGDRLPDSWESAYGLNPDDPADAAIDTDGDGVSNLEERLAGTDPTDPESHLRISRLSPGVSGPDGRSGPWRLEFLAVSNRTYAVQFQDAAPMGPWLPLVDVPASFTNRVITIEDNPSSVPSQRRFFRLATPRPP